MISKDALKRRKFQNQLQSFFLLLVMAILFASIGWLFAGLQGLAIASIFSIILILTARRFSPSLILRMYNAKYLDPESNRILYRLLEGLCAEAGLLHPPQLYYIPVSVMNAFTLGTARDASIALTDGILRNLNFRELNAVLGHEIAHIRNNDIKLLSLADGINRISSAIALIGQILIIIYIPIWLLSGAEIPYITVLLLILSPYLLIYLQMALSRTREYEADLGALELTRDPQALISALNKIDNYHKPFWERILLPGKNRQEPSNLRSHPEKDKRIQNILSVVDQELLEKKELSDSFQENEFSEAYRDLFRRLELKNPKRRYLRHWF